MELFDRVTMQHHFVPMYATLCRRLERWNQGLCRASPKAFRRDVLDLRANAWEDQKLATTQQETPKALPEARSPSKIAQDG